MTQFEKSVNRCVYDYGLTVEEAKKLHKKCFVSFIGLPNPIQLLNGIRWQVKGAKVDWGAVSRMCVINGEWYNMRSDDVKYIKLGECMIDQYSLNQVEGFVQGKGSGATLKSQNKLCLASYLHNNKNVIRM